MATSTSEIRDSQLSSYNEFKKFCDENDIQFVGFEFTDPRGKLQHTDQHIKTVDKDMFENGVMIDGSSIAGWKAINESDMCIIQDWEKWFLREKSHP